MKLLSITFCKLVEDGKDLEALGNKADALKKYITAYDLLCEKIWDSEFDMKLKVDLCVINYELLRKLRVLQPQVNRANVPNPRPNFLRKAPFEISKRKEDDEELQLFRRVQAMVPSTVPTWAWSDIIGQVETKKLIRSRFILKYQRPDLFLDVNPTAQHQGMFFYGPPGTGKSTLAQATANAAGNMTYFSLSPADIMDK